MKVSSCRFCKSLVPFNILNVIGFSETVFFNSGLTKSLTVSNFRNKVAMTIIFFSKGLKFDVDSGNCTKESAILVGLKDNCISIKDFKFSEPGTGYLSLAVNVLRNTPKIQHITKGDIFQIRFSQSNEKI